MDVVVRKRGKAPEAQKIQKMSVSERQGLEQEKRDLEAQKQDLSYGSLQDKGALDSRIKALNSTLAQDEDNEARGRRRAALEKEAEELEGQIKLKVPPLSMQQAKYGTPEYNKAVEWGIEASKPETVRICERYQSIKRMLEPDDPNAGSIEALVANS